MIGKLLESTARNGWIFFLRLLGVALLVLGIVTAGLGLTLAGFTPVLLLLLGLASFLGVICNSLFRIVLILERRSMNP
jgi:hypothetical protein